MASRSRPSDGRRGDNSSLHQSCSITCHRVELGFQIFKIQSEVDDIRVGDGRSVQFTQAAAQHGHGGDTQSSCTGTLLDSRREIPVRLPSRPFLSVRLLNHYPRCRNASTSLERFHGHTLSLPSQSRPPMLLRFAPHELAKPRSHTVFKGTEKLFTLAGIGLDR